jgi:NADH:ubiquinone reductase (H+-translocating)
MTDNNIFTLNIPDSPKPRVVIVGAGFGGINLIKKLDKEQYQVVLLDRYNYHTFQPLLYQVATAGLEPDSVAGPLRKIIKKQNDTYFRMLKVNAVEPKKNLVETSIGILSYDYLIIATGSRVNFFNNDNVAKHAFPVKQVTHALDLRSHILLQFEELECLYDEQTITRHLTYVVVGAGPTGVEICGALSELKRHVLPKDYPELNVDKMQIYLIEGLEQVLPTMSEESSKKAHHYLEKLGVNIQLNCLTESYDENIVKLSNNQEIATNTLIWAAGVRGNIIHGINNEGLRKGNIMVNEFNQVFDNYKTKQIHENMFAIGDVAFMKLKDYPKGHPGLAQVAIQQGKNVAANLNLLAQDKVMRPFIYKNKGVLATVGRNKAVADFPGHLKLSGFIGWIIWMIVHLLFLVGFRNKTVVFANWVWNYFTYDRGIRIILRPPSKKKDRISRDMVSEMNESNL